MTTTKMEKKPQTPHTRHNRNAARTALALAAILLLCIGIAALLPRTSTDHTCYAIIDGQYCDDPQLVQTKALEALQNVGFTDEELKETITLPNLLP